MLQRRVYKRTFSPDDALIDLVNEDVDIIPILSRFSIPLGFGNKTINEVCHEAGISTEVFLLVVNFMLSGEQASANATRETASGIVDFLHNSHEYFLSYKFPHIRANLTSALDSTHEDINPVIVNFFDDYVSQVRLHFNYEENTVWPYIRNLIAGESSSGYNIGVFQANHDEINEKLSDLKNIIMRYYHTSQPNKMYDVLVDIFNCEEDLNIHTLIENEVLIPMVKSIEQ